MVVYANRLKIYAVSLGCPKNSVDTECVLKEVINAGYSLEFVDTPDKAELLFVNTCGFIEAAVRESIDVVLKLGSKKRDDQTLMVMGCMVARYGKALETEIPEVDVFLGVYEGEGFNKGLKIALSSLNARRSDIRNAGQIISGNRYTARLFTTPPWRAYVKISEGCSNRCTYCLIPRLRGGHRSVPVNNIVSEIRSLVGRGVKEITLVGQDLTSYRDGMAGLAELLEEIVFKVDIPPDLWIRLLYLHPARITPRLLDVIVSCPSICRYLDIPVQHASDRVLRAMGRGYGQGFLEDLFKEIRTRFPDVSLRTTVMTGFPGESEDDFEILMDFIKRWRFDNLGVFVYSDEEESASYRLAGKISSRVASARRKKIMSAQARISKAKNASRVDSIEDVLVEGVLSETDLLLVGRGRFQAPEVDGVVYINDGEASPGDLVKVQITDSHVYDLVGRIL
ncbi:MAG: 30S ribosomal protein S12 methylthiotransferase RimO [Dissulfurimicrobium sp.]|uniref:30S ribosomal protein S12 methylthiotransferase RimO n=1 Tax=Dissulfurimicrobium sp. TaxID=2022436 RepID=UPI00404A07EE